MNGYPRVLRGGHDGRAKSLLVTQVEQVLDFNGASQRVKGSAATEGAERAVLLVPDLSGSHGDCGSSKNCSRLLVSTANGEVVLLQTVFCSASNKSVLLKGSGYRSLRSLACENEKQQRKRLGLPPVCYCGSFDVESLLLRTIWSSVSGSGCSRNMSWRLSTTKNHQKNKTDACSLLTL